MHLTCLSVPQCWRWLMIASRQTAVLPVFWSPMISSRWPRPTLVIASIALMPVSSGSLTSWRWTTLGACSSRTRVSSASISPLPSSGRPSGSITRPRKASPTGTDRMRPVWRTSPPSSMPAASPNTTQPTSRTSRLRATPSSPPGNSSSSLAMVDGMPSTRAMPSPVSVTRPTSSRVTDGRNDSTCFRRAAAMSSGRMDSSVTVALPLVVPAISGGSGPPLGSRHAELLAGQLQPGADAAVEQVVADAHDHRPQNSLIGGAAQVDGPAGDAGEHLGEPGPALVVELDGGAHLGHHPVVAPGGQLGQRLGLAVQVMTLVHLDQQVDQGGGAVAGPAGGQQLGHEGPLALDGQAGVGQGRAGPAVPFDQGGEAVQIVLDPVQLAGLVGGGEGGQRGQLGHDAGELPERHPLVLGGGGEHLDRRLVELSAAEVGEQGALGLGRQARVAERLAQPDLGGEQACERVQLACDPVDPPGPGDAARVGGLAEQRLDVLGQGRANPGHRCPPRAARSSPRRTSAG